MIKTHRGILDTSLHEYPSVVGKPIFTIFTQQDIAAPLFLITSYQDQLECAHQALSLSAVFRTTPFLDFTIS